MPLDIPDTALEIENRAKTDVQQEIPESNPFLKNSVIGAIITGFSNRIFDFYIQLKRLETLLFPDTTEDEFLTRWAAIYGLTILPASVSSGNVVATGIVGSSVPISSNLSSSDGRIYTSTLSVVIGANAINVTLTQVGGLVTATAASNHNLSSNVLVTIANANEADYNVIDVAIIVISALQFTYDISPASPVSPATGTITASFNSILVPIQSVEFGVLQNQDANAILKFQSPIVGVDDSSGVDFNQIGGGSDQETEDSLRSRMLSTIQNPIAHFNVADIEQAALTVPGVTRVFVQEITPLLGQVTILFMRDNDINPIPVGSEITDVKDVILLIKPANTGDVDVIVAAPVAVTVNFVFSVMVPNTSTMQNAVTANLQQFFAENTDVGADVQSDGYRSAIFNTIDSETGQPITNFTLTGPVGDVTIASGEIGVLGSVTYP